jgi:hypothetical protein
MKHQLLILTFLLSNTLYSQETLSNMLLIPAGEFTMGKNTPNPTAWQPANKMARPF